MTLLQNIFIICFLFSEPGGRYGAFVRYHFAFSFFFVLFRKIKTLYCGLMKGPQWKGKRNCMEASGKAALI